MASSLETLSLGDGAALWTRHPERGSRDHLRGRREKAVPSSEGGVETRETMNSSWGGGWCTGDCTSGRDLPMSKRDEDH